jgi:hypothetical protein
MKNDKKVIGELTIKINFKIEVSILDCIKLRILGKKAKPILDAIADKIKKDKA